MDELSKPKPAIQRVEYRHVHRNSIKLNFKVFGTKGIQKEFKRNSKQMKILSRREEEEVIKNHKQLGLKNCHHLVKDFADCTTNRTISVLWACRQPHKNLNNCLSKLLSFFLILTEL